MKITILVVVLFFSFISLYSQDTTDYYHFPVDCWESAPKFNNGRISEEIPIFIKNNIQYPDTALKNYVQGTVYISFFIDTIGHVTDIKLLRDVGYNLGKEAVRLIKLTDGMWTPAETCPNKKIRAEISVPIKFAIIDSDTIK